jgi:hypothetical protein
MKTKRSALLGQHRHYLSTKFNELGHGPTLSRQVWVANIEKAISIAKVTKRQFLHTWNLTTIPLVSLSDISVFSTHLYHMPFITPGSHPHHTCLSKTPYSTPHTTHCPLTPSHHPTLFPIFLRGHNTSWTKPPGFFQVFYPANAPPSYDKICAHLHRLHVQNKVMSILPGLVWFDSIHLWLY